MPLHARATQGCHTIRRPFVPVFRAADGFLRAAAAGFLVLAAAGLIALAAFAPVFRAALGFRRASAAGFLVLVAPGFIALATAGFVVFATWVFLALAMASTGAGNSGLGGFGVRWWPWCSDWMCAASSSVRSSVSARFRRSSSRYSGIVLVAMAIVWQNYPARAVQFCPLGDNSSAATRRLDRDVLPGSHRHKSGRSWLRFQTRFVTAQFFMLGQR
jgi:hypothetical protein